MAKKFVYFQPEYVNRFKCNGCTGGFINCCERDWDITIDDAIYKKYRQIKPKEESQEILKHIVRDEEKNSYMLIGRPCPFLTEDKLCGIQLNYGEKYLSVTCATYPRITNSFGKFFERSLTMTCPVAAEMILFEQEPLKFEFVEVPEKIHRNHGRIGMNTGMKIPDIAAELMLEVQIAMISILQERTLSIDQRLIVLCFFVDRLEEIYSSELYENKVMALVEAYKSEKFLAEQVPLMIQSISFDAEKFIKLMLELFEAFYNAKEMCLGTDYRRFLDPVVDTLQIKPDENNQISISEIVSNYERLDDARKNFFEKYSTFLENYLVNEIFLNLYPWKPPRCPSRSLSVFLIIYKVFELLIFSAAQNNLSDKKYLLSLTDWYTKQIDHSERLKEKIFAYLEEQKDFFNLMETLLNS